MFVFFFVLFCFFFFQAEDGIRYLVRSRGLGDVYKRQELSVFLKGLVSPYDTLHCDIIEVAKQPGLLLIDRKERRFVIDLDKNPSKSKVGVPATL